VFIALFLQFFVAIHRIQQMLDVVHKAFAVGEAPQKKRLPAMWTLWLSLLNPGAQTTLTS
jgi:hypothetical protein